MPTHVNRPMLVSTNRLLLVALICAIGAAAAWADSPTYADPGGTCNGMTPCFTTIQAAVDAAMDPDAANSGAFAEVFVFPGTYNEDVDISGINGDSNTGDLSIVTVDAAGAPTPGTVTIQTAANPAFFKGAVTAFMGRVNIDGFVCEITGWDGINLSDIEYDVTISNVVSSFAMAENGLYVESNMGSISITDTDASGNMQNGFSGDADGAVNLTRCTFNNNGSNGASFGAGGAVTISNTSASGNAGNGHSFGPATTVDIIDSHADNNMNGDGFGFGDTGAVTIMGTTPGATTANGNKGDGFSFGGPGSVTIVNTDALGNMEGHGFSFGSNSFVSLTGSNANNNAMDGFGFGGPSTVDITGCSANENGSNGFSFGSGDAITIADSSANSNDDTGFSFGGPSTVDITNSHADNSVNGDGFNFGAGADISMTNCTADGNTHGTGISAGTSGAITIDPTTANGNALGIDIMATGQITLEDVTANNNTDGNGITVDSVSNGVTITNTSADGNTAGTGMEVIAVNAVVIDPSSANGNAGGIYVNTNGPITIDQVTANDNTDGSGMSLLSGTSSVNITGSVANGNAAHGLDVTADTNLTVDDTQANENHANGMQLYANVDLNLTGCEANRNSGQGIRVGNYFGINNDIFLTDCSANENGYDGFYVVSFEANQAVLERVTALFNGDTDPDGCGVRQDAKGYFDSMIIRDSWLAGNANDGFFARSLDPSSLTHEVSGSIICNNGDAGVELYEFGIDASAGPSLTVSALGNWWGSITGPTHPNNAGGTGDAIKDALNGGGGLVPFDPWIDTITGSASPNVVQVGSPANISFQFSGGLGTVFLGQGPGSLVGDPPFLISTNNGVVTTSTGESNAEAEFVNMPNGVLAFTATPAMAGAATIVLDGPCGLQNAVTINAIAADLSVTKTDDPDPVNVGEMLTYTLTVMNDGPDDAINTMLVDTLPADVAFVSASNAGCAEALGTVTCNLGNLTAGASTQVMIVVTPTAAGTITNVAQVASDTGDPDLSNNSAIEDTVVLGGAPSSQPASQPSPDCGIGLCGFGTFGVMPWMLLGLGLTKRRYRRR